MKNTLTSLLLLIISLSFTLQSCKKEKKTEQENLTKPEIQKTLDSTKSVSVETPEKTVQYSIVAEKIDSLQYYSIKKKTAPKKKKLLKITDFKEAKKLLKGVVDFDENPDFGDHPAVKKIHFRNGKTYQNNNDFDYSFFIAYFPEEDILLSEGGHSTDVSFNLRTGQETEETGNPNVFIFSPNEIFRINGSYDGQECSGYFIQKKTTGEYHKIINLEDEFKNQTSIMLCYIEDGFWTDEHTFFLKKFDFDYETGKFKFFKVKILEK